MEKAAPGSSQAAHAGFASRTVAFVVDLAVMSVAVLVAVALVQALLAGSSSS